MAPTTYRLKSEKTLYCPVTYPEVPGRIVKTENGATVVPPDSTLIFSRPVHNEVVEVTITGPNGLFVALPADAEEGTQVIWSQQEFVWEVIPTVEGGKITYQFIPANGRDLYVYDDFDIGRFLVVKPGHKIVAPESYFTITPV